MGDGIETTAEAEERAAMTPHGAVRTGDAEAPPAEIAALADKVADRSQGKLGPAHFTWKRLLLYIKSFEATLSAEEEVAIGQTATGTGVLRIEGIGYFDPDLVTFYGRDPSGAKMQLVQHISQLNVVLRAVPKAAEAEEPRRIGFELARGIEDGSAG